MWHLIRNETGARQAWLALENHFKPCLPQLVLRLQTAWRDLRQKPGTNSFTKFVDDIQDLAAKLDVVGQRVTEIDKAEALVKGIRPDMTSMAYSVKWKLEDAYEDERRAHQNHVRHRYIFDDAVRILRVEHAKLPPFVNKADKSDKPAGSAVSARGTGHKRGARGSGSNANNGPKAPIECYVCAKNHPAFRCPDRKARST